VTRRKLVGLAVCAVVICGGIVSWSEIRRGFSARAQPTTIETFLATRLRKLAMPANYRRLLSPIPASPETIQAGMGHFADHCAACHANDGSGETVFGRGLYPRPPDLRKPETQTKTDGELYYAIENGIRLSGMPAFGESERTNDEDTWHLVLFIRHLPALSTEELAKMAELNPKTEAEREEEKQEQEFLRGDNPQTPSSKPKTTEKGRTK
jgi:mono/diheme cytochrome c family protein